MKLGQSRVSLTANRMLGIVLTVWNLALSFANSFFASTTESLLGFKKLLGSTEPVRIIEGIDVANIGGAEAVGSLVKFIDGRCFMRGYRRF